MYAAPPDAKQLAEFGLTPAEVTPITDLWPCNEPAYQLFDYMGTQWRIGNAGPTGLDYNVLFHKLDRMHLTADRYDELESDVRVMEMAAIEQMRKDADDH